MKINLKRQIIRIKQRDIALAISEKDYIKVLKLDRYDEVHISYNNTETICYQAHELQSIVKAHNQYYSEKYHTKEYEEIKIDLGNIRVNYNKHSDYQCHTVAIALNISKQDYIAIAACPDPYTKVCITFIDQHKEIHRIRTSKGELGAWVHCYNRELKNSVRA